jgi:hypothetical protein
MERDVHGKEKRQEFQPKTIANGELLEKIQREDFVAREPKFAEEKNANPKTLIANSKERKLLKDNL